jgi:hypothetical protein
MNIVTLTDGLKPTETTTFSSGPCWEKSIENAQHKIIYPPDRHLKYVLQLLNSSV